MKTKNKIIIVSGPTATGKTSLALKLAKDFQAEILNFDSLLFYKELNIGTAKPTPQELAQTMHHMVNTHSIFNPINAADFIQLATPLIQETHKKGKTIILVGGSGFYLQALLKGMYNSPTTSEKLRQRSDQLNKTQGIGPFRDILKQNDFSSFERYHENDHYRIRRAVEHFWMTGQEFSKSRQEKNLDPTNYPYIKYQWDMLHLHLDIPKDQHWDIILERTNQMIKMGLIQEVQELLKNGATGNEKPLQSIGYKETLAFLKGEIKDETSLIERISINTRQLAKAQRTWFKKHKKLCYNALKDIDEIHEVSHNFIKS